jgi:hypothetical protein
MRYSLLIVGFLFIAFAPATAYSDPKDAGPPPALPGAVNDGSANFTYASDADNTPFPAINNWVCNHDKRGLVFVWEQAHLSRGIFNPLQSGDCQEDPHLVSGIDPTPDFQAPIQYTQSKLNRTAAIYTATHPAATKAGSLFKTRYVDLSGQKRDVSVVLTYQLTGDKNLDFSIFVEPADLTVALSNSDWIGSDRFVDLENLSFISKAKAFGIDAEFGYTSKTFLPDDLTCFRPSFRNNRFFC